MSHNAVSPRTGDSAPSRDWFSALILQRGAEIVPRFVAYYHQLARRPRQWRRQLRRKLAVTVTGAALLLALAGGQVAYAVPIETDANIKVVNGEVAIMNNGKCSLMEAIWNARSTKLNNMKPDCKAGRPKAADVVILPAGGEFILTEHHNEQFGATGLPVITSAVTIEGNGSIIRRSDADETPNFRILAVDSSGDLTLRNTTIANGHADGYNGNISSGYGGGIFSLGALDVFNATISDNVSYSYGAAGGGIFTEGPTEITDSVITKNWTISRGCCSSGAGLYIAGDAVATITGSTVSENNVWAYWNASGGGIAVRGEVTIVDSTITGNINGGSEGSGFGGGIDVTGKATIIGSTISDNLAWPYFEWYSYDYHGSYGGGLSNSGETLIVNSTISGNSASYGGGLSNHSYGELTVIQSTLSGNDAYNVKYYASGYEESPEYLGDESGGYGGGIFVDEVRYASNCTTTNLQGVIVSGNTADIDAPEIVAGDASDGCSAVFNLNAVNVIGQNSNFGVQGLAPSGNVIVPGVGLSAILSPLADNGGPTMTHALPQGSPALDLVSNALCAAAPVNGVDQRGEPRGQNGVGGSSANECDAGSFEMQVAAAGEAFLISPKGKGTVGGVKFAPADILKYDSASGWSMYFKGADHGITKNLTAFELLDNGDILMSFAAKQPISGAGTFQPQDVARYVAATGAFQMEFDGSANLLSTAAEKIDALGDTGDGRLAISTGGAAAVKLPNGNNLKAQDEDVLGFATSNGHWSLYFDGTPLPGLKAEDVNALWVDPATGDLYITLTNGFNLGGVKGNAKDIVKLTAAGGYAPSLWWDGSAEGFPSTIDGLEILK